jgi:glycogen debranching enzyme
VSSPFNAVDDNASGAIDHVILVNGRTFVVAAPDGSLNRTSDGAVFEDLRMLSTLLVTFTGPATQPAPIATQRLATSTPSPFHAVFVSRPDPERSPDHRELYVHRQWIGRGVRHDIEIHNNSTEPIRRTVAVHIDTDFAHVFVMKAGGTGDATTKLTWDDGVGQLADVDDENQSVEISVMPEPTSVNRRAKELVWEIDCEARDATTISIAFEPCWDGHPAGLAFPIGTPPSRAWPTTRLERWREVAPTVTTDDSRLAIAVESSVADLASLRIFDRLHVDRVVVAAGAPWFMTLFGRDSLLTSWMVLPFLPELAIGTLDTLAELQGVAERPTTEEQPGKILHELRRHGGDEAFAHRGRYYGTVDATPLFVMVAGEAARWGHLDRHGLRRRWDSIAAAVRWIRRGLVAGDGLLRYQRSSDVGLLNQGWKDSWDGISFADGRLPTGRIALAEVQGYVYAALRAAADLVELAEATELTADLDPLDLRHEADRLAERFEEAFWMESHACYAVALDGGDRPVDSVTTNPGHAVWTGITDPSHAHRYLDRIVDDGLFNGWGLRTLAPTAERYDPLSYHNGSVWPHDTALVAAGAARLGRRDVVAKLVDAALDVAAFDDGRPPELLSGVHRDVVDVPVPYPSSCSPQAWSSASNLLHVRSSLQLEPPTTIGDPPRLDDTSPPIVSSLDGIHVGSRRYVLTRRGTDWRWSAPTDPAGAGPTAHPEGGPPHDVAP